MVKPNIEAIPYNVDDLLKEEIHPTPPSNIHTDNIKITTLMEIIIKHMRLTNRRERTIKDYSYYLTNYMKHTGAIGVDDITTESIYIWLESMNVSPRTKYNRLKVMKAFLGKCFDLGYVKNKFWLSIEVKVPKKIPVGAKEKDVELLLSLLDKNTFIELRDYIAITLMYYNGLRVKTLLQLREKHIDTKKLILFLDGDIMKNNEAFISPISPRTAKLVEILMQENNRIREHFKRSDDYIFIGRRGIPFNPNLGNNGIQKRLQFYSEQYGLKNINPHALRRGFARRLLNQGADVFEISKALGHSNLAVTTQYLQMDNQELVERLRKYL